MFSKSKEEPVVKRTIKQTVKKTGSMKATQQMNTTPSIIGSDVKITGNITTSGELQLDGSVEGDLKCGSMTMGESGVVTGSIEADKVIIRGKVKGEVRARSVRLENSAIIEGDIVHESMSVEAGAKLTGRFTHTNNPVQKNPAAAPSATPVQSAPKTATVIEKAALANNNR